MSLNRDDADEGAEELQQRKDAIGKVCLLKLWEYFVDAAKSFGMRRMVLLTIFILKVTPC